MPKTTATKIDQRALLAFISKKLGGPDHSLGKKALQKSVHLLQELGGVDAGYNFSFYTYGPYSSELAGDLDVAAAVNALSIKYNSAENYYLINPGPDADRVIADGNDFLSKHREAIDKVLNVLHGRLAKELELISTIAYLRHHAPDEIFEDDKTLAKGVKDLKPKYSDTEIEKSILEVRAFLAKDKVTSAARA